MNYLKERYRVIFTVLMIYLIFFIAFFLYSLPLYAIIYPVLLSLFLLSVIIFFDYLKLKKKHQQLKEKQLYQVNSQIENDYINIINQLKEEKQKLALNEQNKYQDMIDYYTTWVHQIKTPIASMKLTLDKEDGITARKLNKDLTAIESYVEMVLAYLRLDCSSNDLLIQEVKLDEAIRNAVKHFSSDFIHKKIRIEIINCEQRVLSDEKWLSFIIEQLLSNALKYTDKGIPIFETTCDKANPDADENSEKDAYIYGKRTNGTIYEQAFDIVVINKTAKKVSLVRIGCPADNSGDEPLEIKEMVYPQDLKE